MSMIVMRTELLRKAINDPVVSERIKKAEKWEEIVQILKDYAKENPIQNTVVIL